MNLWRRIHLLDLLTCYVDFMDGFLESSHFLCTMRFESQQIPFPRFIVRTFWSSCPLAVNIYSRQFFWLHNPEWFALLNIFTSFSFCSSSPIKIIAIKQAFIYFLRDVDFPVQFSSILHQYPFVQFQVILLFV